MKTFWNNYLARNLWFHVLTSIAIILLIASWFVPPMAIVDGSVLAAVGEIFGFAALGAVIKAIEEGRTASITHGNTTISVNKEMEEEEDENSLII